MQIIMKGVFYVQQAKRLLEFSCSLYIPDLPSELFCLLFVYSLPFFLILLN